MWKEGGNGPALDGANQQAEAFCLNVKAAVWKNDTDNGVRYNTTFARLYKDGDEWKNTDSFGRDDLLTLAKVADIAHSWIHGQNQENSDEEKGKTTAKK